MCYYISPGKVSYDVELRSIVTSHDSILQSPRSPASHNELLSYPNIFSFKPCQNFIVE
jgi:hypothetical protein